jgi:hypothetical protein
MSLRYSPAFVPIVAVVALCVAACDSATTSSVTTGPTPVKCQLTLAQPSNIVADGGTGTIAVTAQPECAWTVSGQPSWISDVSPTSGQGNGSVSFRAAANPVPSMREGEIIVNDNHVRVMQEAAPCRFTITPNNQSVNSTAGTANVTVSTLNGCTWSAKSNASWIAITSGAQGSGNGSVVLSIAANSGGARTGTVTIADVTHTITQQDGTQPPTPAPPTPPTPPSPPTPPTPPAPPPSPACTFTINPNNESIAAAGGNGTAIAVSASTSSCTWTAVSNASWITVTAGASGTGNGSAGYTAAANTGPARSGTLTVAGNTFTVNQAAPPTPTCTYTLSASSASLSALGGAGSVGITAPAGCAWTATTSASWITVTSGASGTGNGTVGFLLLPNLGAARSDSILIGGQTFTVNQAAVLPACTYTLSASGATVPIAGGTGSFNVTAPSGCSWTAVTGASWITITSGASGTGNGTVAFTAAANPGATRSDIIVAGGQTFTVTQ